MNNKWKWLKCKNSHLTFFPHHGALKLPHFFFHSPPRLDSPRVKNLFNGFILMWKYYELWCIKCSETSEEHTLTNTYRIDKQRVRWKCSAVLIKCGAQMRGVCFPFPNLNRRLFKATVPKILWEGVFAACRRALVGMWREADSENLSLFYRSKRTDRPDHLLDKLRSCARVCLQVVFCHALLLRPQLLDLTITTNSPNSNLPSVM